MQDHATLQRPQRRSLPFEGTLLQLEQIFGVRYTGRVDKVVWREGTGQPRFKLRWSRPDKGSALVAVETRGSGNP